MRRLGRRELLGWMAGAAGLAPLLGCGVGAVGSGECATVPEETGGPYPGDGSNGPNALALSGIVRADLRQSFAGSTGTAEGIPLTLQLTLTNSGNACSPLAGYAIYLWHCDKDGKYSMYDLTAQNYLRGVQETDSNGMLSFKTIFPGCYAGRMPHAHFEIYPSVAKASAYGNRVKTSQLAFPVDACNAVYATNGYSASAANFARTSFAQDMVFSDGTALQMTSVTGNVNDGYLAELVLGIPA